MGKEIGCCTYCHVILRSAAVQSSQCALEAYVFIASRYCCHPL